MASSRAALWICGTITVALALYAGLDPLKVSPIVGVPEFEAFAVEQPKEGEWREMQLVRDGEQKLQSAEVKFRNQIMGPESLVFDGEGRGPYTGLADGRVVRWDGEEAGWSLFAVTSANRSEEVCGPRDPPVLSLAHEHTCGRPLGLRFHARTGELYIADAYFGLLSVGPGGGLARTLATEADGVPFGFTNDVDVDDDGVVYFTDSSTKFQRRQFFLSVVAGDNTGRLLRYDPSTKETKVLLTGLRFPNGVALSEDATFLILTESITGRLLKYWIKGDKAGEVEVIAKLPGFPDNVRRNKDGDFWVAIHGRRNRVDRFLAAYPNLRRYILKLPIPLKYTYVLYRGKPHAMILRYDSQGKLLEVLEDSAGVTVKQVSEVEERDGKLWIGSVLLPQIAVYDRQASSSAQ